MTTRTHGFSLVELTVVLAISAALAATALPALSVGMAEIRARTAARYISALCHNARVLAIRRSTTVALRITRDAHGYAFALYADGNGNGVRTPEVTAGIDPRLTPDERLSDQFAHVDFGVTGGLPAIESGDTPPGSDPIALGRSDILSFTPIGTSSSGTLYVLGAGGQQYAVRVLGATGRTRVLFYNHAESRWRQE